MACPLEWARGREEVVLGWSDQIPVWLKLGRSMQVYASLGGHEANSSRPAPGEDPWSHRAEETERRASAREVAGDSGAQDDLEELLAPTLKPATGSQLW